MTAIILETLIDNLKFCVEQSSKSDREDLTNIKYIILCYKTVLSLNEWVVKKESPLHIRPSVQIFDTKNSGLSLDGFIGKSVCGFI